MKRGLYLLPYATHNPSLFKYLLQTHGARALVWAYATGGAPHWDGNLNVSEVIDTIYLDFDGVTIQPISDSSNFVFKIPEQNSITENIDTIYLNTISLQITPIEETVSIGEIPEEE